LREKQYTHAITFFTSVVMYQTVKDIADSRRIALSEFLRSIVEQYLASTDIIERDKLSK
jgi:hypothetical protein